MHINKGETGIEPGLVDAKISFFFFFSRMSPLGILSDYEYDPFICQMKTFGSHFFSCHLLGFSLLKNMT